MAENQNFEFDIKIRADKLKDPKYIERKKAKEEDSTAYELMKLGQDKLVRLKSIINDEIAVLERLAAEFDTMLNPDGTIKEENAEVAERIKERIRETHVILQNLDDKAGELTALIARHYNIHKESTSYLENFDVTEEAPN